MFLARHNGTPLHVLHISIARELELFEPGPIAGKLTIAEACVHFLAFDDRDFERLGTQIIRSTPRKPTLYKCGCSPFVDTTFRSSIQATIVSKAGRLSQRRCRR